MSPASRAPSGQGPGGRQTRQGKPGPQCGAEALPEQCRGQLIEAIDYQKNKQPSLAADERERGDAALVEKPVSAQRWNSLARRDDPGEVERVRGADCDELPRRRLAASGAKLTDRFGQRELLAGHTGYESATANLAPRLEAAIGQQQVSPQRRVALSLEETAKDDAVAAQQGTGVGLDVEPARRVGRRLGRPPQQRPSPGALDAERHSAVPPSRSVQRLSLGGRRDQGTE